MGRDITIQGNSCGNSRCGTSKPPYHVVAIIFISLIIVVVAGSFYALNTPSKGSRTSTPRTYNQNTTPSNTSALVKSFLANASRFYLRYRENSLVDGFCRALILNGSIVNDTYILVPKDQYKIPVIGENASNLTYAMVSGGLYQYGVLAYMPFNGDYWFTEQLRLGDIVITHIPPQRNITVTGGAGPLQWFRISRGNTTKVVWFTSYAGVVYRNKVICSSMIVKLGEKQVIIVKTFIVVTENIPGIDEQSLWLILLPANTTQYK